MATRKKKRIDWKKQGEGYRGWFVSGASIKSLKKGVPKFTFSLYAHKPFTAKGHRGKLYYVKAELNVYFGGASTVFSGLGAQPNSARYYVYRARTLASVKKKAELLLSGALGNAEGMSFARVHEVHGKIPDPHSYPSHWPKKARPRGHPGRGTDIYFLRGR